MQQYLSLEYCETHRTKNASNGVKVFCPTCGGKDLWVTTSNGRGYCFECSTSYRVGEVSNTPPPKPLNIQEIRKLYSSATSYYRECLTSKHRSYLMNRGLDEFAINTFNIGFCPSSMLPIYDNCFAKEAGLSRKDGTPTLADRIVFPYYAMSEITDMRGRVTSSEEEPRYKSPIHRACLRGAIFPFNHDRALQKSKETKTVIITEGEIKAIFGDLCGFAVMALPGISTWRYGLIIEPDIRYIIIFDNSAKREDRIRIDKSIYNISKHIPYFSVGTLPLLGSEKMDIDSFLLHKHGGPQKFKEIIDSAIPYSTYKLLRKF